MITSFQRSHFFSTASFFPGLSKFQQPIFFNNIILRFPAVTFLSWPLYNFFPANHFFFWGQIERLFQTTYQIFFLKKEPVKYLSLAFIISFQQTFFFFVKFNNHSKQAAKYIHTYRTCQIHTHI